MSITAIDEIGYIARVDGESMTPTLNPSRDSEYVFLNKVHVKKIIIMQIYF